MKLTAYRYYIVFTLSSQIFLKENSSQEVTVNQSLTFGKENLMWYL